MAAKLTLPSGSPIFKEGDQGNAMYIILEGVVEIYFTINRQETKLATLRKGDFFGEMALFRAKPRSASARVIIDADLASIDSRQQLERFLVKNPAFAAKMVTIMATRLANTNEMLIEKINETSAKQIEYQQVTLQT
ncbi:MAG: cyclic nucleotide-binding domain-containing protein [Leptospira sp.]|nr:cyclic nucleotide-binding domain-containing protein [Leptospira sp.]